MISSSDLLRRTLFYWEGGFNAEVVSERPSGAVSVDNDGGRGIIGVEGRGELMVLLPNADKAVIPMEKFVNYALDICHADGRHKAFVFDRVLGYTVDNASGLIANIKKNIVNYPATHKGKTPHGDKYEIIMQQTGANGCTANVVTGWMIDNGTDVPRLTTAILIKR